jgi:hypothetical protein
MPQVTRWAAQQQKMFSALSRSFIVPPLTKQPAWLPAVRLADHMSRLGLTEATRRQMFPLLQPSLVQTLAGMPSAALLAQRVRLPDATYDEFRKSLQHSLALYQAPTVAPNLQALSRRQSFTIAEVMHGAREAADLAEREGEKEEAEELIALTAEAVEVIESPSTEKLEQMVAELGGRLDERLDALQRKQDASDERREGERRDDLTLSVFFWFLTIYLSYFMWLLDNLPKE